MDQKDAGDLEKQQHDPVDTPMSEDGLSQNEASHTEDAKPQPAPQDPNLVTWDGPDDPENPRNWSFSRKWAITGMVSLISFMTPITSSMIAPAAGAIAADLHVTSEFQSELIFSIFLLPFVIGPFFMAPCSELYGRVIVLQLANVWFLIFNLVCGFAQNTSEMLAFRFLSGLGACAPQTIGGGFLSDVWKPEQRGMGVALYTLAPMLGPSLGPLMGAWITERSTWRWCFWSVTIFGVVVQLAVFFFLSETSTPYLLIRKAQRLRNTTGNEALHSAFDHSADRTLSATLRRAFSRVFILLGTQPIVQFLAVYMSLIYGIMYLMLSTFPSVWTDIYHESIGIGGLNYISLMLGLSCGAFISGHVMDYLYRTLSARSETKEGRPEFRVPLLFLATFLVAGGLLMFGWSAQEHTHWIVPNIGATIFALGVPMSLTGLQSYTIDCYQAYAASAVGAVAAARSLTGFGFPLFADYMFNAVGEGWGNTILGLATLVIGYAGSLGLWFLGPRLRAASPYAKDP